MLIISLALDQLSWFSESLSLSVVLSRPLSPAFVVIHVSQLGHKVDEKSADV